MRVYAGKWSLEAGSICVFWINLPITVFFDCKGRSWRGCGSVVCAIAPRRIGRLPISILLPAIKCSVSLYDVPGRRVRVTCGAFSDV